MSKIIDKTIQFLLYAMCFFTLLKMNHLNLIVAVLLFLGLIKYHSNIIPFFKWERFRFTLPFWIILISSLFYIEENSWYKPVEKGAMFLIYPLIFFLIPNSFFDNRKKRNYLLLTKLSCLITLSVLIGFFIYKYSISDFFSLDYRITKFRDYAYNESPFVQLHPTYLSLLLVFLMGNSFENLMTKRSYFEWFFVCISYLGIFMLLSKLTITLAMLLTVFYVFKAIRTNLFYKITLTVLFLIFTISVGIKIPGVHTRFTEIIDSFNTVPEGVAHDSTNIRMAIYRCDISLIKEHWLWGMGSHNLRQNLTNCLKDKYNASFHEKNLFLSHNYFIYILLSTGVLGFFVFCYYIFSIFKTAKQIQVNELNILLTLVLIACFTEDYLFRNFGNFTLHFFLFVFLKNYQFKEK